MIVRSRETLGVVGRWEESATDVVVSKTHEGVFATQDRSKQLKVLI
jgi:hypothetical protein